MSTKRKHTHVHGVRNPLQLVALKDRVRKEDTDDFALIALLHLDGAKRGQLPHAGYNTLATVILAAASIASQTRSKRFYDMCGVAYKKLVNAGLRPTKLLDLTTSEYQAIRDVISWYVRALPKLEVGVLATARAQAEATMGN